MGYWEVELGGHWKSLGRDVGQACNDAQARGDTQVRFETHGNEYVIDLNRMTQTNIRSGKSRLIRCKSRDHGGGGGLETAAAGHPRETWRSTAGIPGEATAHFEVLMTLDERYHEALYYPYAVDAPAPRSDGPAREDMCAVTVEFDSFRAGLALAKAGFRPVVLNMANEFNCGGAWCDQRGSQEEALFRASSLPLSLWPHRREKDHRFSEGENVLPRRDTWYPLTNCGIIYSPAVRVMRSTKGSLPEEMQGDVSVVSAAAQDLRPERWYNKPFDPELLQQKARAVLSVCASHGHDAVVLGAFGCGAFKHDPHIVAAVFDSLLAREFRVFRAVVFGIVYSEANLNAFSTRFPLLLGEDLGSELLDLKEHRAARRADVDEKKLEELNNFFVGRSYIGGGIAPTSADHILFEEASASGLVPEANRPRFGQPHPHWRRWCRHIAFFPAAERQHWPSSDAALGEGMNAFSSLASVHTWF